MDLINVKEKLFGFYNSKKKLLLIGGGVLVLIIAAAIFFTSQAAKTSQETTVQYVSVTKGSLTESIDVVGTLKAQPMVTLAWESGGIVSPFNLKIGDKVLKDKVLLTLEDASLSSTILQAQSSLLNAQATLDNLLSANTDLYTAAQTLSDAEYNLRQHKTDRDDWNVKGSSWDAIDDARAALYAAQQVVWEKDATHKALASLAADNPKRVAAYKEYESAVAVREKTLRRLNYLLGTYYDHSIESDFIQYDYAKAAVEEARVDYIRYLDQSDEISAAKANVQALQNTIDQALLAAPFDGTVTEIFAVAGEQVTSGDTAVRIDNLSNLLVQVSISEVDINKVSIGQKAIVTFDALPDKEYQGEVNSISSAGADNSGVIEFNVTVRMLDADVSVKPGFTSVVSIITNQVEDVLLVPTSALISRNGSSAVIKTNSDGSYLIVPVKTGSSSDTLIEILSGDITEGDELAVYSANTNDNLFMPPMPGGGAMPSLITGGGSDTSDGQRQTQP